MLNIIYWGHSCHLLKGYLIQLEGVLNLLKGIVNSTEFKGIVYYIDYKALLTKLFRVHISHIIKGYSTKLESLVS